MNPQSSEAPFCLHDKVLEPTRCWQSRWRKSLGFWGRVIFTRLLETKVIYFILVKYTRLYMCKAHAESFVQLAEESCNIVSYLKTSKVACQGRRKVGRIQHPKWRSTKSSWCSYRRPIEVQRQSCHRCAKSGVCFLGTSKCSMGSAQQSAAISKVWPNPKRQKVDWGGTPESILAARHHRPGRLP